MFYSGVGGVGAGPRIVWRECMQIGQYDVLFPLPGILVCRAFQFRQKKVSIRFDFRYRIDFFDSIRQSDKFAACTLIFK